MKALTPLTLTRHLYRSSRREWMRNVSKTTLAARLSLAAIIMCMGVLLRGSQESPTARGFSADQVHQIGGVDSVNVFNGNLTVAVPLGRTYMAGDRLAYSFRLAYNSAAWDHEERCGGNTTTTTWKWSAVRHVPNDGPDTDLPDCLTEAIPNRSSNAGFGWTLTFGQLLDSRTYIGSDGGIHTFFPETYPDGNVNTVAVMYTRDASYLRLRRSSDGMLRTVDLPDGSSQEFLCKAECGATVNRANQRFDLQRIYNAFGNEVTIDRGTEPAGAAGATWRWTIREKAEGNFTTEHYIDYRYNNLPGSNTAAAPYKWIISSIDLAAPPSSFTPGTEVTETRKAHYQFNYSFPTVPRPVTHDASQAFTDTQSSNQHGLYLPILTSVTLPPDEGGSWTFGYFFDPAETVPPFVGRFYETSRRAWLLNEYRLPTGGGYRFEYGPYRYPRRDCDPTAKFKFLNVFISQGVRKRWEIGADGNTRGEPWRYIPNTDFPGDFDGLNYCDPSTEFRTLLVDPLSNVTENYFSIFKNDMPLLGWDARDYGLPLTRRIADPLNGFLPSDQRWLSSRVYKCTDGAFDPAKFDPLTLMARIKRPGESSECGAPVKETYVRYEYSGVGCSPDQDWDEGCTQVDRRLASQRTVYHAVDSDTLKGLPAIDSFASTTYSDYDGVGHYREERTNGDFGLKNFESKGHSAGDVKVTRTNYNPTGRPAVGALWNLGTYDEISTWEENTSFDVVNGVNVTFPAPNGTKSTQKFFFDAATGLLYRVDQWAALAADQYDVRVLYSRVPSGTDRVIAQEKYYGGDRQSLNASNWEQNPDYVIARTFRFGALEKIEYRNCGGGVLQSVQVNEIDPNTSSPLTSTDSAGVRTAFDYDSVGRMKKSKRGGDAATLYDYTFQTEDAACKVASYGGAKAPRCAKVTIKRDTTGTPPQSYVYYDHLGRSAVSQRLLPGSTSYQQKTYWANGWLASESAEGTEADISSIRYPQDRYDALGRATRVIHADAPNGGKKTEYTFSGVRITARKISGLALEGSDTSSTTSFQYDRQGRLVKVSEPADGTNNVPVLYSYDVLGRLRHVDAGNQTRSFVYDNRGFLLSETHPELHSEANPSWTGTVLYGDYDSRGNYREKYFNTKNSRSAFDLTLGYDSVERLQTVSRASLSSTVPAQELKEFQYYGDSDPVGSRGQRKTATRFNYGKEASAISKARTRKVVETFTYDSDGRLGAREIKVDDSLTMSGSFDYDVLGNLNSITYPKINGYCAGCPAYGADRTLLGTFSSYGFLTKVADSDRTYLQSMSYHPNGAVNEIKYGNSVVMTHGIDPWNLPRPSSISTSGVSGGSFDVSTYVYDAAGNLRRAGDDFFLYDAVGRLTKATLKPPTGNGVTQTFDYDRHGNIETFNGQTVAYEPTTNRLKTDGDRTKYDRAGNLTNLPGPAGKLYAFDYDPLGTMMLANGGGVGKVYVYTADDERIGILDYMAGSDWVKETWSFRGPFNQVLRDFIKYKTVWRFKDYIYRGSLPLATVEMPQSGGEQVRYLHLDHLGSTRLITSTTGAAVDSMKFFPFGGEMTQTVTHSERRQFTGQERDDDAEITHHGDIDYMHARYYKMTLGRFLSIDPIIGTPEQPQSWNRYAYVMNNPMTSTDPDGRATNSQNEAGAEAEKRRQAVLRGPTPEEIERAKKLKETRAKAEAQGGVNPAATPFDNSTACVGCVALPSWLPDDEQVGTALVAMGDHLPSTAITTPLRSAFGQDVKYDRTINEKSRAYSFGVAMAAAWDALATYAGYDIYKGGGGGAETVKKVVEILGPDGKVVSTVVLP
jgi:RHS repeat-associated protein